MSTWILYDCIRCYYIYGAQNRNQWWCKFTAIALRVYKTELLNQLANTASKTWRRFYCSEVSAPAHVCLTFVLKPVRQPRSNTECFVSFPLRMQWKTSIYLYMFTSGYKYPVFREILTMNNNYRLEKTNWLFISLFHRAFWFMKFYSHQLMHFFIQLCISLLSYIKIT